MPDSPAFVPVVLSLAQLVGEEYADAVCRARSVLTGEDLPRLRALAEEPVDFYPASMQRRLRELLPRVGEQVCEPSFRSTPGATTRPFREASRLQSAPLSGLGYLRLAEDGRLHLLTKSEHYHAPLGHGFPGYRLLETARRLGIPQATHNNTRGHITRLLEEELIREANGLPPGDRGGLSAVLASTDARCLNRVLNLQTGSLAAEAALKMTLARFYRSQEGMPEPSYRGRTPVYLVIGTDEGGPQGNYHGTNLLVQALRGMWPELSEGMEAAGLLKVQALRPNSLEDLEEAFRRFERPPYKIAGFFHEIVMMNYGARVLTREFLTRAYKLCGSHDVPTFVDEIQSCVWAPDLFLFREYGLRPSFAAVGKGIPGGEYSASRILFSAPYDNLAQFGALVTNGQEEIASLAYLVTLRWVRANREALRRVGDAYEERLRELAARHRDRIVEVPGSRHLSALCFDSLETAQGFAARLNDMGLDISVQTYKTDCPPVVLTKIPLIADLEVVDFILSKMEQALGQ